MGLRQIRRDTLTRPIFKWAQKALPPLSDTESEAIGAGDIWWEAELFSGNPDWSKLLAVKPCALTDKEQAFIDGPCETLCSMVDDWAINHEYGDLPQPVWQFLRDNRFFGMIIPEGYGGLGFSAYAHSEVVRKISTGSLVTAVTVMVPNSLGPGELLLQFGTDAQRDHWLPRLADGRDLPAFGLTSTEAGSDASAMTDRGVVCKGQWQGEEVTGIRLNWRKRYITLGPVATVLGLAFKLDDPDHLVGDTEHLGITCALVPTDLPGVTIGRRHIPSGQMFQNGPNSGEDVFVPLDAIIGGADGAGKGWMMLMSALAAGRGISLPSQSAAATAMSAHTAGAYARVRQQFGIPIGKFGGIQRPLARLAAGAYALDAARRLTCAGLDEGHRLAVISGIMKSNATYRMRDAVTDAMDIHAGKTVINGPKNYLENAYRAIPVAITVEGANILTRNLIIFGQGSIRCHPHILDEMRALGTEDRKAGLDAFDAAFWSHVGHTTRTVFRAFGRGWTGGRFAPAPDAGLATPVYRTMAQYSAAFALTADMAFLTLAGALKRKEMLSARMGDILSELYFISATVKRWEDEGRQEADFALVDFTAQQGFARIGQSFDAVCANLPSRWAAGLIRLLALPGHARRGPSDRLTADVADILYASSPTRDRITQGLYAGTPNSGIAELNDAFTKVCAADDANRKLREAKVSLDEAKMKAVLSAEDIRLIEEAERAVELVVEVDDFAPEEIMATRMHGGANAHRSDEQQAAE